MMASSARSSPPHRLLLCLTGSVASMKAIELICHLQGLGMEVKVMATPRALHFVDGEMIRKHATLLLDQNEWDAYAKRGDLVIHIEVRIKQS